MTQLISAFSSWLKDTSRYYNTIYELSRLTDRELQDIGLSRGDIINVANQQLTRTIINNMCDAN
jgi:uncharacterized protein YjiS (DUF1127 family)